jgi:hypothetical protein
MATVWLTYAWQDNEHREVDFVAQELQSSGLTVKLDRWNLEAGRRLWAQIEHFICCQDESDAWLLYATQNSLGSEACKEEYAYALDRALDSRDSDFPIIALFPSRVDATLIPAGIRTRLYVSLTDAAWKERIKAAAEGRTPSVAKPQVAPFYHFVHDTKQLSRRYVIEVRPRAGTWSPFVAAIPVTERNSVNPEIAFGPANRIPMGIVLFNMRQWINESWWFSTATNGASPTQSHYISCDRLPSELVFGVLDSQNQYRITF